MPIEAHRDDTNFIDVPVGLTGKGDHYALEIDGDSMMEAGILDGDLLAVHASPEARNGQIVVVRLEDEVTVKRFKRRGKRVRLLPENPDLEPIEGDLRYQELVIEGVGVGVLRTHPQ